MVIERDEKGRLKKGGIPWNKGMKGKEYLKYYPNGTKQTNSFKKGMIPWNKGKHGVYSKELIEKKREFMKGRKNTLGYKFTEKQREKLGDSLRGKYIQEKSSNWKGGTTSISKLIRNSPEFREWRKQVFERDKYVCKKCGIKSGMGSAIILHPHHKKALSIIIRENKIKIIKEARECKELWDVNNGETLCSDCHQEVHSKIKLSRIKKRKKVSL